MLIEAGGCIVNPPANVTLSAPAVTVTSRALRNVMKDASEAGYVLQQMESALALAAVERRSKERIRLIEEVNRAAKVHGIGRISNRIEAVCRACPSAG